MQKFHSSATVERLWHLLLYLHPMYIASVTEILTDSTKPLFINTKQHKFTVMIARNITICNTSNEEQQILYLINKTTDDMPKGAIYFGLTLDPGETISPPDKAIPEDYCIRAIGGNPGVLSFVCDIYSMNDGK